jgi:hypothetical protein
MQQTRVATHFQSKLRIRSLSGEAEHFESKNAFALVNIQND